MDLTTLDHVNKLAEAILMNVDSIKSSIEFKPDSSSIYTKATRIYNDTLVLKSAIDTHVQFISENLK